MVRRGVHLGQPRRELPPPPRPPSNFRPGVADARSDDTPRSAHAHHETVQPPRC